jgi:hypothetical protein
MRGAEGTGRSRRRLPRPNGGKVRAAQRDACDDHEGVSDVPRRRGFSGDKARRVGEGIESAVPAITVLLVVARPVNLFK